MHCRKSLSGKYPPTEELNEDPKLKLNYLYAQKRGDLVLQFCTLKWNNGIVSCEKY